MKTELERFISKEPTGQLQAHHLFLTQLYLLSNDYEKKNGGSPLTVFQVFLQYIAEITDRNDPKLDEYMKVLNERLEKNKV